MKKNIEVILLLIILNHIHLSPTTLTIVLVILLHQPISELIPRIEVISLGRFFMLLGPENPKNIKPQPAPQHNINLPGNTIGNATLQDHITLPSNAIGNVTLQDHITLPGNTIGNAILHNLVITVDSKKSDQ